MKYVLPLLVLVTVTIVGYPSETLLVAEGVLRVVVGLVALWLAGIAAVLLVVLIVVGLLAIAELVDRVGRFLR